MGRFLGKVEQEAGSEMMRLVEELVEMEEQVLPPGQRLGSDSLLMLVTLGHLMGIGGCMRVGLNMQRSGTGVLVATLKRGHSRMSGWLVVRGMLRSRGEDSARRQGGCS